MWEDKEEVSAPSATAVVLQQAPRRTANRAQVLANLGSALVALLVGISNFGSQYAYDWYMSLSDDDNNN